MDGTRNALATHGDGQVLTEETLALENACYRGTAGVSDGNRGLGMRPAFFDHASGTTHLSRFADGCVAPVHLLDGLPADLVLTRDECGRARSARATVEAGFERGGRFYSRAEAAAFAERLEHELQLAEHDFAGIERARVRIGALDLA
ncbi:MAG TPA: hypothetical protein VFR86_29025 [Burkholderiaceae bacterium]|nr:hypothetical protein [Burkholderiaceae bacterium]